MDYNLLLPMYFLQLTLLSRIYVLWSGSGIIVDSDRPVGPGSTDVVHNFQNEESEHDLSR